MQELFNSVQEHFPKVLDRSRQFLNAQLKLQLKETSSTGPLPYLGPGWKDEHHPPEYHTTSSRTLRDFSGAHPSALVLHMRSGKLIAPSVWVSTVKCFNWMNRNHLLHKCQGLSTCHFLVNKEFQHDNIFGCYWPYFFPCAYWGKCEQSCTATPYIPLQLGGFLPAALEMRGLICTQTPKLQFLWWWRAGESSACAWFCKKCHIIWLEKNPNKTKLFFLRILECNKNMHVLPPSPPS